MDRYIESCLTLYDLKVDWHYNKPDKDYNHYFFDYKLSTGLKVKCRSDAYYVFDFTDSPIGKPIKWNDMNDTLYIRNERVEVMHAFLACIRFYTQKHVRRFHTWDMDFLDNYIICTREEYDLENILLDGHFHAFSSREYMELCKIKHARVQSSKPANELDHSQILTESCDLINKLMKSDANAVYILGILYRAAVYHKLGLEIHSAIFVRSVFEWLAIRHDPKMDEKDKGAAYAAILEKYNTNEDDKKLILELRKIRGDAVHRLIFPKHNNPLNNPISDCFKIVEGIFNKEFDITINIPLGQTQHHILDEY